MVATTPTVPIGETFFGRQVHVQNGKERVAEEGEKTTENWEMLPEVMDKAFDYINERFGQYPYKQYSFIQGGDGGMAVFCDMMERIVGPGAGLYA